MERKEDRREKRDERGIKRRCECVNAGLWDNPVIESDAYQITLEDRCLLSSFSNPHLSFSLVSSPIFPDLLIGKS